MILIAEVGVPNAEVFDDLLNLLCLIKYIRMNIFIFLKNLKKHLWKTGNSIKLFGRMANS